MKLKQWKSSLKRAGALVQDRIATLSAVFCILSMPVAAQAQSDEGSNINAALAQDAVMALLPKIPAEVGLAPEDYISGNGHDANIRLVQIRIGPDGHMIPSADWQNDHPAQCRKQARETNAAAETLEFKMIRTSETLDGSTRHQYYTFARLMDPIITGESTSIHRQANGEATVEQASDGSDGLMENADAEGLNIALRDALANLAVTLGTPQDGCGDIRLTHQFGSMVDEEFGFVAGFQNESGPGVIYEWEFGDGSTGSGDQIGRHTYTEKGTYTVTVHVGGEGVRNGSASITVIVGEEEEEEEEDPIQPRNGTWSITLVEHEFTGCSPRIAAEVESAMSAMVGNSAPESLTFQTPFHPAPLMKHADGLEWEQIRTNAWLTILADNGNEDMSHRVALSVEVVSPVLIREVQSHTIKLSARLAGIMGTAESCGGLGFFDVIKVD